MVAGELSGNSEWLLGSCRGVLSGCWGVVGEF